MTRRLMLALAVASLVAAVPVSAKSPSLAQATARGGAVDWALTAGAARTVLTVSQPDGTVFRKELAAGEAPSFSAVDAKGQSRPDGVYQWELRLVPEVSADLQKRLTAARQRGDEAAARRLQEANGLDRAQVQTGAFALRGGVFLDTDAQEGRPAAATAAAGTGVITAADQVIPDDLIVQGSGCFGFDCVNNESFGFDTIRLKENNLRIKFEDTSTGAFPTNDWQLTANDSASGGASKFSIEDITGAKVPFTVTAGASTNSIFVDSTGRVGFRTATPVLDLHVNTSNTPALRLEQNNSGGFTAQTWDVAGNEANFFVRDVTGGSRLSFRIRPGAPTSSVDISASGDVGIGTSSPDEKLHVFEDTNANSFLLMENPNTGTEAAAIVRAKSNAAQVNFQAHSSGRTASRFGVTIGGWGEMLAPVGNGLLIGTTTSTPIILGTNGTNRLQIANTGAVTIAGNLTVNGTFSNPSSRELKEGFVPIDPSVALAKLAGLPINEWSYRSDAEKLRHIGPTVEDFQSTFGLGTQGRYIFPMDVQGVTIAAVQGLYQLVQQKDAEIAALQQRLDGEMAEMRALLEKIQQQQ